MAMNLIVGLSIKGYPKLTNPMKNKYEDHQLITLGTYAFEQQFLIRNGYKVLNRYRLNGASFVLAQKDKQRVLFLMHITHKEKIVIDSLKRTKKDRKEIYKRIFEEAQLQGALPALGRLELADNPETLLKIHPSGQITILETDKGNLYVSQPLAKLEYRTRYDKH
jgi:hypothetical protein